MTVSQLTPDNTAVWTLLIRATSSTPSSSAVRVTSSQVRQLLTLQSFKRLSVKKFFSSTRSRSSKVVSGLKEKTVSKLQSLLLENLSQNVSPPTTKDTVKLFKVISVLLGTFSKYFSVFNPSSNMPGQLIGRLLGLPAYRDKTTAFVLTAQQTIYRAIIVLLTVTAILWMAVFLYVAFYYSYMPAISHTRPVHLQFDSCGREQGLCSFPTANVTLTRRQQLLMVGQPYRVLVELEMPESKRNQDAGMFMVCLHMKDAEGVVMDKACRAAMLHYRSKLLQYIVTTTMIPFLMSGSVEEKQMVAVELFSGFEEDPRRPVTEAMVQVQSQHVEVYKVSLRIHAHFTGLRYFMFHWPVLSAFTGIMTNLFFLSVIAFLSWYKFFTPKQVVVHLGYDSSAAKTLEERRQMAKERLMRERSKLVQPKPVDPKEEEIIKGEPEAEKQSSEGNDPAKSSMKDDLEKDAPSERRTSDEYEVIVKDDIDKEKSCKDDEDQPGKEEDKENIPASKQPDSSELRRRRTEKDKPKPSRESSKSRPGSDEEGGSGRSSKC